MSTRARGFTLVEVLVALAILGVVSVLAYRGTAALTGGEARLAEESARWRALDQVFDRLEADLREAVPRSSRHGAAREAPWLLRSDDASGDSAIVFSRAGPEFTAEPGRAGQRVGYRLREHGLYVLFWPQLDNVAERAPTQYRLVNGVAGFRVAALAADGKWSAQWPVNDGDDVPRAVRVELVLGDGTTIDRLYALR